MNWSEELPSFTENGAVGSKRHNQRLAIIPKQTQKTVEMSQADAPL